MDLQIWIRELALEKLEWVDPILSSTGDSDDNHQGYKDEVGPVVNHDGYKNDLGHDINHGGDDDVDDDLLLR